MLDEHKCDSCNITEVDLNSHDYPDLPHRKLWFCDKCFKRVLEGEEIIQLEAAFQTFSSERILIAISKTSRTMNNFMKKNDNFKDRYDVIIKCHKLEDILGYHNCDWVLYDYPEDYEKIKEHLKNEPGYRRLKPKEYKW